VDVRRPHHHWKPDLGTALRVAPLGLCLASYVVPSEPLSTLLGVAGLAIGAVVVVGYVTTMNGGSPGRRRRTGSF
jgi:hypothetical protein